MLKEDFINAISEYLPYKALKKCLDKATPVDLKKVAERDCDYPAEISVAPLDLANDYAYFELPYKVTAPYANALIRSLLGVEEELPLYAPTTLEILASVTEFSGTVREIGSPKSVLTVQNAIKAMCKIRVAGSKELAEFFFGNGIDVEDFWIDKLLVPEEMQCEEGYASLAKISKRIEYDKETESKPDVPYLIYASNRMELEKCVAEYYAKMRIIKGN